MPSQKKHLETQLRELDERNEALAETVRRLATHSAVLAVAVRDPNAVPPQDLDAALAGIEEIAQAR